MLLSFHQTQSGNVFIQKRSFDQKKEIFFFIELQWKFIEHAHLLFISPNLCRNMTDLMIKEDVIAFIGPDESCLYEALVASAWNLPMISYVSFINGQNILQLHQLSHQVVHSIDWSREGSSFNWKETIIGELVLDGKWNESILDNINFFRFFISFTAGTNFFLFIYLFAFSRLCHRTNWFSLFLCWNVCSVLSQVLCGCKSHQQDFFPDFLKDISWPTRENIQKRHCPFEGLPVEQIHYRSRYAAMDERDYTRN